jgi:hypothetical protein
MTIVVVFRGYLKNAGSYAIPRCQRALRGNKVFRLYRQNKKIVAE